MSPKQADRIIRSAQPITVRSEHFSEVFTATFTRRDRWNIYGVATDCTHEGCWDRSDLQIIGSE